MKSFPDHTFIGDGYSWTATFDSHDWAHNANFYFTLKIYRENKVVRSRSVSIDDRMYGDINCKYSNAEISEYIHAVLDSYARKDIRAESD